MTLRWQEGDRIFERMVEVTEEMSDEQTEAFLARLVFLLANEIDDANAILSAIDAAAIAQA
jgi:hypothetical protein